MIEKKRGSKPPLPAHTFFPAPKEIISILEPTALCRSNSRQSLKDLLILKMLFLFIWKERALFFSLLSFNSVQFSSVAQSCPTLCNPMNHSTPGLPVHHQLGVHSNLMSFKSVMPYQPSHPLSSPSPLPPIPPSIRVFSNESALPIRWPKDWSFSISFRTGFL